MKDIHIKLRRYSTAVGALLAVSGTVPAAIIPGTFNAGNPSLDRILDHDEDIIYIDIDNDGTNEFSGAFNTNGPYSSAWIEGIGSENSVVNDQSGPYENLMKFNLNDLVGPSNFSYSFSWGYIFNTSDDAPISPAALGAPFDNNNEGGYVGVIMHSPGGDQYGWIQIAIDDDYHVEFIACASESSLSTPIPAGNTATVPLLPIASATGMGLVGLMAALKRRKKNVNI